MRNQALHQLQKIVHTIEDSCLALLLIGLIAMSLLQIAFRNLGLSGFIWFDTATRIMVLWLALLGAMRASRLQNHIAIDLVNHYSNEAIQRILHFITSIASAIVCGTAAWFSYKFVVSEYEFPANAFLNVPTWATESIIPFSLGVISLRFLLFSLKLPEKDGVIS